MTCEVRHARVGFTLVEIVVVIAIITALGGIIFAAMGPAREKARRAVCMSNLHQIGIAITLYRNDTDGADVTDGPQTAAELGLPPHPLRLLPYLRSPQVLRCPDEDWDAVAPGVKAVYTTSYVWNMVDGAGRPVFKDQVAARGENVPIAFCLHHDPKPIPPNEGNAFFTLLRLSGRVEGRIISKQTDQWQW
jgi:type II secretory pathway pseudopilin PulG